MKKNKIGIYKFSFITILILWFCGLNVICQTYKIVSTGQKKCYDSINVINPPLPANAFYGQDAQNKSNQPSYTKSQDGLTIYDNNTGLTWQVSPDTNGDGIVTSSDKLTVKDALLCPAALNAINYGGYNDWRLPSIKELYSLIEFTGTDPSGYNGTDTKGFMPFLDTTYFKFVYGDINSGERIIDAQYATTTSYGAKTMGNNETMFGVNFADGRIKGYPKGIMQGGQYAKYFVRCVRGNNNYGINDFHDNGDSTITDSATGLIWTQYDYGIKVNWQGALAWVQTKNTQNILGHKDWRLPNVKELQSIIDYTRAPDVTNSPAINPLFKCTQITNEAGQADYPCYWSSTTHAAYNGTGAAGAYVAFGRGMGYMNGTWMDVHGAGCQRSDPKSGNPADFPQGRGPQGDAIRIFNYVRLVRDADTSTGSKPDVPYIQFIGDTSFCDGGSVILFIASQTGVSYQWKNGTQNVGANSASYTATTAGNYAVVVTNSYGSVSSSNNKIVIVNYKPASATIVTQGSIDFCDGDSVILSVPSQKDVLYQWKNNQDDVGTNSNTFTAFISGIYTVEITNNCGTISSSNSITVTVNPKPSTPSIIMLGKDTLSCSVDADLYIWYLNGVKTNFDTKKINAVISGNYTVAITQNGCTSDESEQYFFVSTGVHDEDNKEIITLFPNPANDFLFIKGEISIPVIIIYNVLGEKVKSLYITNNINISDLRRGMYFIIIDMRLYKFIKY